MFMAENLPKLIPTNIVENKGNKLYRLPPSEERAKLRSKTFTGIASAMAEQWAGPCAENCGKEEKK